MKRSIVLLVLSLIGSAACSREPADAPAHAAAAAEPSAWLRPPEVAAVARQGGTLIVSGTAGPRARVVLRGWEGQAVAASAALDGRFDIRLPAPSQDALLSLEVQSGEETFAAPTRLLVLRDETGPAVLLSAGQPTRRLGAGGPLDAVDSDGTAMILSGRAAAAPTVTLDGRPLPVVLADGRWRAEASASAGVIRVGKRVYDYPGGAGAAGFSAARAGAGWRVVWSPEAGGSQSVWLPDAA